MGSTVVSFSRPDDALSLGPHIASAAARNLPMVEKDCHLGQRAVICSTGPSILDKKVQKRVRKMAKRGDVVFALKESIPLLKDQGIPVKYSVSMDPGSDRQVARTPVDFDVTYCIASSCHPALFDHVLAGGAKVQVFHSACGHAEPYYQPGVFLQIGAEVFDVVEGEYEFKTMDGVSFCPVVPMLKGEIDVYREAGFTSLAVMEGGFTVTNRALALTKFMGFRHVTMAGTDFGWRNKGGSHYASIVKVPAHDDTHMSDHGVVDGTEWFTRPDQLASAADVAKRIQRGEVTVLGDSLAVALSKKPASFVEDVVRIQ